MPCVRVQNGDPVLKSLLHSTTSDQKVQWVPLTYVLVFHLSCRSALCPNFYGTFCVINCFQPNSMSPTLKFYLAAFWWVKPWKWDRASKHNKFLHFRCKNSRFQSNRGLLTTCDTHSHAALLLRNITGLNLLKMSLISWSERVNTLFFVLMFLCFHRKQQRQTTERRYQTANSTEALSVLCSAKACVTCWRCAAGQQCVFVLQVYEQQFGCSFANGEVEQLIVQGSDSVTAGDVTHESSGPVVCLSPWAEHLTCLCYCVINLLATAKVFEPSHHLGHPNLGHRWMSFCAEDYCCLIAGKYETDRAQDVKW